MIMKDLKKIISVFLVVALCATSFNGLKVNAGETQVEEGLEYTIHNEHIEIEGYNGIKSVLVIPDEIEGMPVTVIKFRAFYNNDFITKITLPKTLNTIGGYSFAECSNLKEIEIVESVKTIGAGAFENCEHLKEMNLNAIDANGAVSPIVGGCSNLKTVHIGNKVKSIPGYIFGYSPIENVTIPDSVEKIGGLAFAYCNKLKEITLPEGIKNFGNEVFVRCTNLHTINYNAIDAHGAVAAICGGCKNLKTINFSSKVKSIPMLFFSESGIETVDLPESLEVINVSAFAKCTELEEVTIPANTRSINTDAFAQCMSLYSAKVYSKNCAYNVNNQFPTNTDLTLYGYRGSTTQTYAEENNIRFVSFDDEEQDYNEAKVIRAECSNYTTSLAKNGHIIQELNENHFNKPSTVFDFRTMKICRFAAALSTLAYNSDDGRTLTKVMSNKAEKGMNLSDVEYHNDETADAVDGGESSPFWIGHKKINIHGENINTLYIILRGTKNCEWINNFESGVNDSVHKGFEKASQIIFEKINNYIKSKKINSSKLKILLTGHSRGAAVSNLIGAKIDNAIKNNDRIYSKTDYEDLFVYTFATPNVTSSGNINNSIYENIYNIVNPEDFVTKVMPSSWGYGRYGKTFVLPSKSNTSNYQEYYQGVRDRFNGYVGGEKGDDYGPYRFGMYTVNAYIKAVTLIVGSNESYYKQCLNTLISRCSAIDYTDIHSLYTLYKYALAYFMADQKTIAYSSIYMATSNAFWGVLGELTIGYFFISQVIDRKFEFAHTPENYLANVNELDSGGLSSNKTYIVGTVNCPVDLQILNSNNEVIGEIKDNEITEDKELVMNVSGDSKIFNIPNDLNCKIRLVGTNKGEMDYSLSEVHPDTGEKQRSVYLNVPLEKNKEYTEQIETNKELQDYELKERNGDIVDGKQYLNHDELRKLRVDISVEGRGGANSLSNLTQGDYVTLSAIPENNNEFLGWYDKDDNLVSTDVKYSFSIENNMEFKAKFTDNFVDVERISFDKEKIYLNVGEEVNCTVNVIPNNANYKHENTFSSNDEGIATVDMFGNIKGISPGKTTIKVANINGTAEAYLLVEVKDNKQPETTTKNRQTKASLKRQKPGKVKIKSFIKKKKSLKLKWRRVKNVKGYQIAVYNKKKYARKNKKRIYSKYTKKIKCIIKSRKIRNKKRLFARVRAYCLESRKRIFGKWSKIKRFRK